MTMGSRTPQAPATRDATRPIERRPGAEPAVVPPADVRTYYDRPVLKVPVWGSYIPAYFFAGGVSAGSALVAAGAQVVGDHALARRAQAASVAAIGVSSALLVADLGRPERFHHMLRVAKVTSPMSVGTWVLAGFGPATGLAAVSQLTGLLPRLGRMAQGAAAALAPAVATYTAVLLTDTAVPAWHGARRELPFAFAGSAVASAAGLAAVLGLDARSAPAIRRLAVAGAAVELGATQVMEQRLGELAAPYRTGAARRLVTAAKAFTAAGAATLALAGGRRRTAATGGALLLAGSLCERFAIFHAGLASARDPRATIGPQRARLAARSV
jgi:formate-dependent nitrite reductase membrane component NrfD